jgi:hypothetical protein
MGVLHDLGQAGANVMTGITNASKMATAGREKGNVGSKVGTMLGEVGGGLQSGLNDVGTMGGNAVGKVVNAGKKELVGGGDIMKDNRQLETQKAITQNQANQTMKSDLGKANGGLLQGIHAGYDATDNADTSAMKSNPIGTVGKMVGNDIGVVPGVGIGAKAGIMGASALAEGAGDALKEANVKPQLQQARDTGREDMQAGEKTINNTSEALKDRAQEMAPEAKQVYDKATTTVEPSDTYTGSSAQDLYKEYGQ